MECVECIDAMLVERACDEWINSERELGLGILVLHCCQMRCHRWNCVQNVLVERWIDEVVRLDLIRMEACWMLFF